MLHRGGIRLILAAVAAVYGLDPKSLRAREPRYAVSHPRQVAAYLARRLTNLTLQRIANDLGYLDHTTVMYGDRAAQRRMSADPVLAGTVANLALIVTGIDQYDWPPNHRAPFEALVALAGDRTRPPHDIAATLRCALTLGCSRLAGAGFPPRRPPEGPRPTTPSEPLPILQFIETHPAKVA